MKAICPYTPLTEGIRDHVPTISEYIWVLLQAIGMESIRYESERVHTVPTCIIVLDIDSSTSCHGSAQLMTI